jgi:hypothetical protein
MATRLFAFYLREVTIMPKTLTTAFGLVLLIFGFASASAKAQPSGLISGITIENAQKFSGDFDPVTCVNRNPERRNDLNKLLERIDNLGARNVTVRVVFQQNTHPSLYRCILKEFKKHNYQVMGLIFDSEALATYRYVNSADDTPVNCANYDDTRHDYKSRVKCYIETLNPSVDIWEAGNEVNGEWADEGCVKDKDDNCISNVRPGKDKIKRCASSMPDAAKVVEKIRYAVEKTAATGKPVALTLIHQPDCTSWDGYEMFDWFGNIESLLPQIKYLLVSYYEGNCDNGNYYKCDGIDLSRPPFDSPTSYSQVKYNYCYLSRSERPDDRDKLRKIYWNVIFDNLHRRASVVNSDIKVGFGEVGCTDEHCDSKIDLLNRYYSIRATSPANPATIQPWFIGGYFWWTAQHDMLTNGRFYPALQSHFRQH